MKKMKNALVILAGGIGSRFSNKIPKQFIKFQNYNFIEYFLKNITINDFNIIVIGCDNKYRKKYLNEINKITNGVKVIYSKAGKTRQETSFEALKKIKRYKPVNVLIHDAARPLCSNKLVKKILFNLSKNNSSVPFIINNDKKISSISKKDIS